MVRTSAPFLFLPHFDIICDLVLNRRTATWNLLVKYIYSPPNNFFWLSLDKTDHVIQNLTLDIRRYPPSDLISVAPVNDISGVLYLVDPMWIFSP